MKKYGANREKIFELLDYEGGVTEDSVRKVSAATELPEAEVWGAGLFYTLINSPGNRVRICDGLTCQMAGADELATRTESPGQDVRAGQLPRAVRPGAGHARREMELVTLRGPSLRGVTPHDPELPMNLAGPVDRLRRAPSPRELGPEPCSTSSRSAGLQGRGGAGLSGPRQVARRARPGRANATSSATPTRASRGRSRTAR